MGKGPGQKGMGTDLTKAHFYAYIKFSIQVEILTILKTSIFTGSELVFRSDPTQGCMA